MAESADPSCTQLRCYLPVFQAILVFTKVVPPYFATRTPALNRDEGSKNIYLRHQKKIFPWNPLFSMALATVWRQNRAFLWYLHRFGSGASRPQGFCRTLDLEIEHSQGSTLPFRQHLQHFGVRIFDFRWLL